MNPDITVGDGGLALDEWKRIDAACDRFEAAWRAGERPDLAEALDGVEGPARSLLFRELLTLDLEFRLGLGERPEAVAYSERFPDHLGVIDAAFTPLEPDGPTLASRAPRGPEGDGSGPALMRADLAPAVREALGESGYEVLGELGRGGMGVVYLARKLALNRHCALKMILAGPHAGSAAAARFRAEAEAVARLRDPGIVQIYHVGEAGGLPYLELEYLPGGSLDRSLDGSPWPARQAASLLEVLAGAIAEAHRRGIVHRDLKPANILLDTGGHPKVADFGLAKLLDSDGGLTKTHTVLGSPSYMAPEQAEGDSDRVGAATDVYALGAILYELLTGRPPFRAATALETLAQVKAADPVPPSRFQPGLSRDVETICLKCLEKDPGRRYASAAALAEDLRRFRAGEPILARPAPPWELAWKWARRRPTLAAAALVSGAAVLLMLGGAMYYNARLRDAVAQARRAEEDARANARAAVSQRNLALKALDQLIFGVQEKLKDKPATRVVRQEMLATAIAGLDEIGRSAEASAPDLSRAAAHRKLGDIYRQIGRGDAARRQYEQSRRLAAALAAREPDDLALAECLRGAALGLGLMDLRAERYEAAIAEFRRAVDLSEAIARADPRRDGARIGLLEAYLQLGRAYSFWQKWPEAETWFRTMHDLAERWLAAEPHDARYRDMLATSYRKLGDVKKLAPALYPDPGAARADYDQAITIGRALLEDHPEDLAFKEHLAVALDDLAGVAQKQREFAQARPLSQEAERRFSELVAADPESVDAQLQLAHAQLRLARIERDEGQLARAMAAFRQALARLNRLESAGLIEGRPSFNPKVLNALRREAAECEAASTAAQKVTPPAPPASP